MLPTATVNIHHKRTKKKSVNSQYSRWRGRAWQRLMWPPWWAWLCPQGCPACSGGALSSLGEILWTDNGLLFIKCNLKNTKHRFPSTDVIVYDAATTPASINSSAKHQVKLSDLEKSLLKSSIPIHSTPICMNIDSTSCTLVSELYHKVIFLLKKPNWAKCDSDGCYICYILNIILSFSETVSESDDLYFFLLFYFLSLLFILLIIISYRLLKYWTKDKSNYLPESSLKAHHTHTDTHIYRLSWSH